MVSCKTTFVNLAKLDEARFKQLCVNANKLLKEPIYLPDIPTGVNLEKILNSIAEKKFMSQFGYPYRGSKTIPSGVAADAKHSIVSTHNTCSITDDSDQIGTYVDSTLLKSLQLEWARADVRRDLVSEGKTIFTDTAKFWNTRPYVKKYDSPKDPQENSFKIDAIAVYCNVPIPDLETNLVVYYIGVHYEICSPTKTAKINILNNLIESANSLLVNPIHVPTRPSWSDLERILGIYGKQRFKAQFGFPYCDDKTRPKDIAPHGRLSGVASLFTEDLNQVIVLPNIIPEHILCKMKTIPEWAQDSACIALKNQVESLFVTTRKNVWSEASFEDSYDSDITTNNSCKTVAKLISTKGSSTVDDVTVRIWCVYYIGIFYDTPSPVMVIRNNLLTMLCKAANELLTAPIHFPSPPNAEDLNNILVAHGNSAFKTAYGFVYQGDRTVPDDVSPGTPVQAACGLLEIEKGIPANLDIQLERKVFNKIQFPSWVSRTAKDDLRKIMEDCLREKKGNTWSSNPFSDVYPCEAVTDQSDYTTAAILTFCNASLKTGGITIAVSYIHYTGVYYSRKTVL